MGGLTVVHQINLMSVDRLEELLENPKHAPFYDLLGGLSDNLLTIGSHAGTFLTCHACGDTFTLKGDSWKCECCGQQFELKFASAKQVGSPFETKIKITAKVSGLTKRWSPHWYYENENWSVAEFMTQILRLQSENFLVPWLERLGIRLQSPVLDAILCWPRFRFGGKTIQPDVAIAFERDIVLFEFKRPGGGLIPPVEVIGQLCFGAHAGQLLRRDWHLVLVPGRESIARGAAKYIKSALAAAPKAQLKWLIPEAILSRILSSSELDLAAKVRVLPWEILLRLTCEVIGQTVPESSSREQVLTKLRYFFNSRVEAGLFAAAPN
jgi:hypothetical protein